jgi:hypothetical protein
MGQGILTIVCLFSKGDGLVKTGVSIGTWRNNVSPVVATLNCGQLGRTMKALVLNGDLACQVRMCSTHCTAKDHGGLQYTYCPAI